MYKRGEVKRLKNSSANSQLISLLLLFLHHEYLSMRLPRNNDEVSSGWKGKSLLQFLFFFISLQLFYFIFQVTTAYETTNDFHCGILPSLSSMHLYTTSAVLIFSMLLLKMLLLWIVLFFTLHLSPV